MIINKEYFISEQKNPFDEDMKIISSQILVKNAKYSLCNTCKHKANGYKNCKVANLLYELALKTNISTLVRWCPSDMYSFDNRYNTKGKKS